MSWIYTYDECPRIEDYVNGTSAFTIWHSVPNGGDEKAILRSERRNDEMKKRKVADVRGVPFTEMLRSFVMNEDVIPVLDGNKPEKYKLELDSKNGLVRKIYVTRVISKGMSTFSQVIIGKGSPSDFYAIAEYAVQRLSKIKEEVTNPSLEGIQKNIRYNLEMTVDSFRHTDWDIEHPSIMHDFYAMFRKSVLYMVKPERQPLGLSEYQGKELIEIVSGLKK